MSEIWHSVTVEKYTVDEFLHARLIYTECIESGKLCFQGSASHKSSHCFATGFTDKLCMYPDDMYIYIQWSLGNVLLFCAKRLTSDKDGHFSRFY